MKRALVLVAVVLSACGGWVAYQPASRIPFDARLGLKVVDGDPLIAMRTYGTAVGSKVYVAVVQALGRKSDLSTIQQPKTELFEIDFANNGVKALPASPLQVNQALKFGVSWTADTLLLEDTSGTIAVWNGTSWKTLPAPPGQQGVWRSIVDERHVLFDALDQLAAFDGTTWITTIKRGVPGPMDASGIRLLFADQRGLCTELLSWTTLQPTSAAICTANASGQPFGPVFNGRVDDFQVLVDGALHHFSGGVWTRGVSVSATSALVTLPGALTVPLRQQEAGPFPSHLAATGGQITGLITPQLQVAYDCACNRSTDPSCGCMPFSPTDPLLFFTPDGTGLISLATQTIDAKRATFARKLELPMATSPWGPVCTKTCAAGERCEIVVGTSGFASDVCMSNDPMQSLPKGKLTASVRQANPGTVSVALSLPDGGVSSARVLSPPPNLELEGTPLEPLRITLSQPEHEARVIDVTFPDAARTAELGDVPLLFGKFVTTLGWPRNPGPNPWGVAVPSAGALFVPEVAGDGGVSWIALQTSGSRRVVAEGQPVSSARVLEPMWFPRQGRVLVPGPSSLVALDDVTLAQRGSLAGSDFLDERTGVPAWSQEAVVLVSRSNGLALVRVESQALSTIATFPGATTTAAQLSADGGITLRLAGAWRVDRADGTNLPLPNIPVGAKPVLEASGRAVFFLRNGSFIETELGTGTEREVATNVTTIGGGRTSDRIVGGGSLQDGGFAPFADLYASGVRVGPFATAQQGVALPGGTWLSAEGSDFVLRTIDDGVARATFPVAASRTVPLQDDGFAAYADDPTRAVDVRYFRDGVLVATHVKGSIGAVFGASDSRQLVGRKVMQFDPATGATSDERFIVDDATPFSVDPVFAAPLSWPRFPTGRLPSSRGMPCALFSTPHLEWTVAADGSVVRDATKTDFFCAP